MTVGAVVETDTWVVAASRAMRRLSAVTCAGAVLGLLVGGVGSRLAMLVLARLNPLLTGTTSDDGFTMGHLTPATFNLLAATTIIGVLGGGIYFVLRGLTAWLVASPLLLWIPLAPFLGVLLLGLAAYEGTRRSPRGHALLAHPAGPWLARGALAALFVVALAGLVRDTTILT